MTRRNPESPDWRTWEEMQVAQEIGMDRSNLRRFIERHGLTEYLREERDS